MSFLFEYLNALWASNREGADKADQANWEGFMDSIEKDRQRDRIIAWKDRVTPDNFAVNSEEAEYYRRSAGFVWRIKDPSGTHKARNHQYLYNLDMYGHKEYKRRDKGDLEAAQKKVDARAASGELGPISPLQ